MDISISLTNREKAEIYRHALKTVEKQFLAFLLSNGYDPETFSASSIPESYADEASPNHGFYKEINRITDSMTLIRTKLLELEQ